MIESVGVGGAQSATILVCKLWFQKYNIEARSSGFR